MNKPSPEEIKEFEEFFGEVNESLEKRSPLLFDKTGKFRGFATYAKPAGQNPGYDCPVEHQEIKPETIQEKLKRISKPKIWEKGESDEND